MSNLMTNIRKASLPLGESVGRLLLSLGQAADSTLDAETLAELDKQATIAACQALAAASGEGDGDGGEEGGGAATATATASEGGPDKAPVAGDDTKEDGVHEESSVATTVDLLADSSHHDGMGSSGSSSRSTHPLAGDFQIDRNFTSPSAATNANITTSSSSLMRASSPAHSAASSHAVPLASPSSPLHGSHSAAPSPLLRSAPGSREVSLVLPLPSPLPAGATVLAQREPPSSASCPVGKEEVPPTARRKSTADGSVTVVLQGLDSHQDDKLVVCQSRALPHLFTRIRNRDASPQTFRFYASRMMRILAEEGIACLESSRQFITTPTAATFSSVFVDESNVCVVSILRAGDALAEAVQACIPTAPVGKILIQRDEESEEKSPVLFYKKFPPKMATMQVLLCDPMVATGGSGVMAIRCVVEAGVKESSIVFVTVVVCPEGLRAVRAEFPEVTIVCGAVDDCLDQRRYILPGLGDFGDRFFGTVS